MEEEKRKPNFKEVKSLYPNQFVYTLLAGIILVFLVAVITEFADILITNFTDETEFDKSEFQQWLLIIVLVIQLIRVSRQNSMLEEYVRMNQ